jgi:hypothetical protein
MLIDMHHAIRDHSPMASGTQPKGRNMNINEARDWLIDCGADRDLAEAASDAEVLAEIDSHYVGGVRQFEADTK